MSGAEQRVNVVCYLKKKRRFICNGEQPFGVEDKCVCKHVITPTLP